VAGALVLRRLDAAAEVRRGLWGRGVIALDESGQRRVAGLPPLLADDFAASLVFAPHEQSIVPGAHVVVHTPRTFGDLLRPPGPRRDGDCRRSSGQSVCPG